PFGLFGQVADQARRAAQQADALERGERPAEVEQDRGDRAVDVDRQAAAYCTWERVAKRVEHGHVRAADAAFAGELEQEVGAWIGGLRPIAPGSVSGSA